MLSFVLLATSFVSLVAANAEKIIFLGPAAGTIPLTKPTLSDLNLPTLSPDIRSIRTNLSRVFPNDAVEGQEKGQSTWLLLDNLTEGQRYEFRVCWSAVEPTAFSMDVYDLNDVWETPRLMVSLTNYAYARLPEPHLQDQDDGIAGKGSEKRDQHERTASVLLLHIQAAADYFSHHEVLMKNPPPVLADLILDPYLLNVLPQSLLPTVGYITVVALATWVVARWVTAALVHVATEPIQAELKKTR